MPHIPVVVGGAERLTRPLGQNARLVWVSISTIEIGVTAVPSYARDSTDFQDIEWTGALLADITLSGAGGLDTGAEASDTWYAVHVIGDSNGANAPDVLLSLSATAPTLPGTHDLFRHLGWVRNLGADLLKFVEDGSFNARRIEYDHDARSEMAVLTGGASLTLAVVDLSAFVPPTSDRAILQGNGESNADGEYWIVADAASVVGTAEQARRMGLGRNQSGEFVGKQVEVGVDSSQQVDYAVSGATVSLDLHVTGYYLEI